MEKYSPTKLAKSPKKTMIQRHKSTDSILFSDTNTVPAKRIQSSKPVQGSAAPQEYGLVAPSQDVKNYVLDTNVLLHDPQALTRFEDNAVVIPIEVVEEIDRFKGQLLAGHVSLIRGERSELAELAANLF